MGEIAAFLILGCEFQRCGGPAIRLGQGHAKSAYSGTGHSTSGL